MIRALAIVCALASAAAADDHVTELDAGPTYASDIDGFGFQLAARRQAGALVAGLEWSRWNPGRGYANRFALLGGFVATAGDGSIRGLVRCSGGVELVFMTQTGPIFAPGMPTATESGHEFGVEAECSGGILRRNGRIELGVLAQLMIRRDAGTMGGEGGPPDFTDGAAVVGISVVARLYD